MTGRDEPIGIVIHMCMEATQGISLCSYLYLKLAKMPCFSYFHLCVFFNKVGEQEGGTGSAGWGWDWHRWGEGGGGKRGRRMNMIQITYTHVCKYKNDTCWNCSRN
jgi:hypothetical protein